MMSSLTRFITPQVYARAGRYLINRVGASVAIAGAAIVTSSPPPSAPPADCHAPPARPERGIYGASAGGTHAHASLHVAAAASEAKGGPTWTLVSGSVRSAIELVWASPAL